MQEWTVFVKACGVALYPFEDIPKFAHNGVFYTATCETIFHVPPHPDGYSTVYDMTVTVNAKFTAEGPPHVPIDWSVVERKTGLARARVTDQKSIVLRRHTTCTNAFHYNILDVPGSRVPFSFSMNSAGCPNSIMLVHPNRRANDPQLLDAAALAADATIGDLPSAPLQRAVYSMVEKHAQFAERDVLKCLLESPRLECGFLARHPHWIEHVLQQTIDREKDAVGRLRHISYAFEIVFQHLLRQREALRVLMMQTRKK